MSKVFPTESVVNIYDRNILWYSIPGFPGYQISTNGYLRSFKSAKKYPYGIILEYYHKDGQYFNISDVNNSRYKLSIEDIWFIVNKTDDSGTFGYDVSASKTRNSRMGVIPNKPNDDPHLESKRVKSHKTRAIRKDGVNMDYRDLSHPDFDIPNYIWYQ